MIEKVERRREYNDGYSEDKGIESLVQELLDKVDELVDYINENCSSPKPNAPLSNLGGR